MSSNLFAYEQLSLSSEPSSSYPSSSINENNDITPVSSAVSLVLPEPTLPRPIPQRRPTLRRSINGSVINGLTHEIAMVNNTPPAEQATRAQRSSDRPIFNAVNWNPKRSTKDSSRKRESSSSSGDSTSSKKPQKGASILRRASNTWRNVPKTVRGAYDATRSRPSSSNGDMMEGVEHPGAPSASTAATFLKSMRMKQPRHDTPAPANNGVPSIVPGAASMQIQMPPNKRPGESARKAAALHNSTLNNEMIWQEEEYTRKRLGSMAGAADSAADLCGLENGGRDSPMVNGVDMHDYRRDPVKALPNEIVALIFSFLDAESLEECQRIPFAPQWQSMAKDHLIWRGVYLDKYQKRTYVDPAPIQIGGVGVGKPDDPNQRWERMHTARTLLDRNWAQGLGKAIYMAGHTDSVYCVQFDEHKIITGSRDRTIRVWDTTTYQCIKVIGGPSVRPTPGPKLLRTVEYPYYHFAQSSVNGTAYGNSIYHVPSDFHSASILCLQYDDEILVTGSSDNDLIVWDIATFEPRQRLRNHTGGVLDVAFDTKYIVSCSKDCTIAVWDRKTLTRLAKLEGHRGPVNAVQLRGHLLVSASGDGVAKLWDLNKMACIRDFPAKERGLAAVEFSDDARYVLAGGNDHVTYKFEVATGLEVGTFTGHTQLVRSLFLDSQNGRVVSGSYDLDLRVYDFETGKSVAVFNEWTTSWMLAAKSDYRRIVSTSQDGRVLVIDFGINQDGRCIPGIDLLRGW
ncbi:hypothetical protein M8818_003115 [Zalaria obscura]|uniref:Uncharacterized protein n=1 Tax=Zalaria obscura TaxID=2024903 RepID=A0ACC3SFP3_9PEZI